jgi:hypothetical protein
MGEKITVAHYEAHGIVLRQEQLRPPSIFENLGKRIIDSRLYRDKLLDSEGAVRRSIGVIGVVGLASALSVGERLRGQGPEYTV